MPNLRLTLLTASAILGCTAFAGLGACGESAKYPDIQIREESGATQVTWDGQLLAEFKENRFLRFRATPKDENWVGSEKSPADLGWVYRDDGAKGMMVQSISHDNNPEKGEFVVRLRGKKPQFESEINVKFTGIWMPETSKFKYTLSTSLQCPLEKWYEHSKFRQRGLTVNGESKIWTEVIDYCIEGISTPERLMSPNIETRKKPLMYEWFVKSNDGKKWKKWPKVHIPYPVRPGDYITIRELDDLSKAGAYYGFLDMAHGGWMTRIDKTPAPMVHEICWARVAVHMELEGAIPPKGSAKNLSLEFEMTFEPIGPERAREIAKNATEIPWRDAREFDLPLFSWNNRFDSMLKDLPGEETANHTFWWPSDYDCHRDDTTGYDDKYSLTIKRKADSPKKSSAWSTMSWKQPFHAVQPAWGRRFRLSAMVKTQDCAGSVRLAHYTSAENIGDMYYGGGKSHSTDGTPKTDGVKWEYSESLTGTRDWTPLSLEFTIEGHGSTVVLEHVGAGQSWFDNVKIEDLGKADLEEKK